MRVRFRLLLLLPALAASSSGRGATGCQKQLTKICPGWDTEGVSKCDACAKAKIKQLEPECTLARGNHG